MAAGAPCTRATRRTAGGRLGPVRLIKHGNRALIGVGPDIAGDPDDFVNFVIALRYFPANWVLAGKKFGGELRGEHDALVVAVRIEKRAAGSERDTERGKEIGTNETDINLGPLGQRAGIARSPHAGDPDALKRQRSGNRRCSHLESWPQQRALAGNSHRGWHRCCIWRRGSQVRS